MTYAPLVREARQAMAGRGLLLLPAGRLGPHSRFRALILDVVVGALDSLRK